MVEWCLPADLMDTAERSVGPGEVETYDVVSLPACQVCDGHGEGPEVSTAYPPYTKRQDCPACHRTGLAGVEWRCVNGRGAWQITERRDDYCVYHGRFGHDKGCGPVLVVPLERRE